MESIHNILLKMTKTRVKVALKFRKVPNSLKLISLIIIVFLTVVLISTNNQKSRMIRLLELEEEHIIEVIEREDETIVFHKGVNKEGKTPIYIVSYVERKGFNWIYRWSYFDSQIINGMGEYYSTIQVVDAGDDNYCIVTGVVKGLNVDKVLVTNDSAGLTDIEATTRRISDSVTLWYKFVDKSLQASYTAEFVSNEGEVLYSTDMKDSPLEAIQKIRGYEIPNSNVIDISETDIGTLVFYFREIDSGSAVYCYELLEETSGDYTWITGGQHSDGRLDGVSNVSSVQYTEHLTKSILDGFIYGVMKSDTVGIHIKRSAFDSSWPYIPRIVPFSEGLTLWYSILPDDFGENYDVIFASEEGDIIFIESNWDYMK